MAPNAASVLLSGVFLTQVGTLAANVAKLQLAKRYVVDSWQFRAAEAAVEVVVYGAAAAVVTVLAYRWLRVGAVRLLEQSKAAHTSK